MGRREEERERKQERVSDIKRDEERERKRRREGERGRRLPELSDYEQINPIEGTRAHFNMQQMSPSFLWMDGRKTVFRKQGIHQPRSKKRAYKISAFQSCPTFRSIPNKSYMFIFKTR